VFWGASCRIRQSWPHRETQPRKRRGRCVGSCGVTNGEVIRLGNRVQRAFHELTSILYAKMLRYQHAPPTPSQDTELNECRHQSLAPTSLQSPPPYWMDCFAQYQIASNPKKIQASSGVNPHSFAKRDAASWLAMVVACGMSSIAIPCVTSGLQFLSLGTRLYIVCLFLLQ
jgi:hypothetical protein